MNLKLTVLGMALIGLTVFLIDRVFLLIQNRVLWWKAAAHA
jgi:hypothetical protein